MKIGSVLVVLTFITLVPADCFPREEPDGSRSDSTEAAGGVVFLVRHAETTGTGPERPLSEVGSERARGLAERLRKEGIERILSTDTVRTRATAEPLALRLGLQVEIYDHRRLDMLAAGLRRDGGRILVVGHSNTTPELVELLGGEPGPPITEDEHDRLYRLELPGGRTVLERLRIPPQRGRDESSARTPLDPSSRTSPSRERRRIAT